jgi:hypothetical protein
MSSSPRNSVVWWMNTKPVVTRHVRKHDSDDLGRWRVGGLVIGLERLTIDRPRFAVNPNR